MSTKRLGALGKIARITSWERTPIGHDPAYVVCIDDYLDIPDFAWLYAPFDTEGMNVSLASSYDVWTYPSDDEIPDHVWAALAVRALTE